VASGREMRVVGACASARVAGVGPVEPHTLLDVGERVGEQRLGPVGVAADCPPREPEVDDRVDEGLLRAVVEVAHEAAARLVAGA
jgi:hypothetical protein